MNTALILLCAFGAFLAIPWGRLAAATERLQRRLSKQLRELENEDDISETDS